MRRVYLAAVFVLSACAGRTPDPVPLSDPNDEVLSCQDMEKEMEENRRAAMHLAGVVDEVESRNMVAAFGLPFIADLSDADRIEMRALVDRNRYLNLLHNSKDCDSVNNKDNEGNLIFY